MVTHDRTIQHPSNRLHRGEARDFLHACGLAVAAAQMERQVSAELDRKFGPASAADRIDDALNQYEAAAVTARELYKAALAGVRDRVIADLRAAGLNDWADAYEADDYSGLAI